MSNIIEVNTSTLSGDINKMQDLLSQIVSGKEGVSESVHALDSMWSGTAHDTFMAAFAEDYELFNQLCSTISKIILCMENAKVTYDNCEDRVRTAVNAIHI